jgi:hypothetical protein
MVYSAHLNGQKPFQSTHVQKLMPAEICTCFLEVRILRRAEEDHGTSVRRIVAAAGIGVPLVRKILHEH